MDSSVSAAKVGLSWMVAVLFLVVGLPAPAQEVDLSVTTDFIFAWNDSGSGGDVEGSFWNPDTLGVPNVVSFGSAARSDYDSPIQMIVGESLTGIGAPGGAFAYPTTFTQIWNDSGSGANFDGTFWAPVPPAGYVSLGSVAKLDGGAPAVTSVVCVRSDLVVQGIVGGQIYNDLGTGANTDFSVWDIVAPPGAIDLGLFIGVGNYSQPPNSNVWCLREDAIVTTAPSLAELQGLIGSFGPILRLHPSEAYLPDDPSGVLDDANTTLMWSLVTNPDDFGAFNETPIGSSPTSSSTILDDVQAALSNIDSTASSFRYYVDFEVGGEPMISTPTEAVAFGNASRAKAYVRARPLDGIITELQFWIWYPWNGPGKAEAECGILPSVDFNPTGDAGTHYADWENVRVRLSNKLLSNPGTYELLNAQLSRHSFDVEVAAAGLTFAGTNPIVYVAKDSHAHYTGPGTFDYARVSGTDIGLCTASVDTYDQTANGGVELNTSSRYEIVSAEWPSVSTHPPDWFFFAGQWGGFDRNQFCVDAFGIFDLYCFEEVGNGKPGLMRRDGFDATNVLNANLGSLRVSDESRGVACSNPDAFIDNFTPVQDTVTLAGGPTSISDVEVSLDVVHSWVGDLNAMVTSPAGTTVLLHDNEGGSADHLFVNYVTSGNANAAPYNVGASMVAAASPGIETWIGEDANGTWTLDVIDGADGDAGVVNRWCVTTTDMSSLFDPDVTDYSLDVDAAVTTTTVTPQAMNHEATVELVFNGVNYAIETDDNPVAGQSSLLGLSSLDLPLNPGPNSGTITVSFPSGLSKSYDLTINKPLAPAPDNDQCIDAIAVGVGTVFGTTADSTVDGSSTCGGAPSPDVWYTFTAPEEGTVEISTCGSEGAFSIDTVLNVFDGCGGVELGCNDDSLGVCSAGLDSALSLVVSAGETVFIRVGTFVNFVGGTVPGDFQLNVAFTPDGPPSQDFRRGDVNNDGTVAALTDALSLLNFGFSGGMAPPCILQADVNGDGSVAALIDGLALLNFGFAGGPPPPAPGVNCGPEPIPSGLDCVAGTSCP